ncbi:hypothetical protein J6590_022524 [Homalodisca vitripennis]|nr:hypothetical protein J6590_022524 [Homalodisca vitripennis]
MCPVTFWRHDSGSQGKGVKSLVADTKYILILTENRGKQQNKTLYFHFPFSNLQWCDPCRTPDEAVIDLKIALRNLTASFLPDSLDQYLTTAGEMNSESAPFVAQRFWRTSLTSYSSLREKSSNLRQGNSENLSKNIVSHENRSEKVGIHVRKLLII